MTKTRTHRDLLVDLKYVTSKQKFALEYEGSTNVFEVHAISTQSYGKNTSEDLESQLEGLEIDPAPQIWIVGWDTTVEILPADTPNPLEPGEVRILFPLDTPRLTSAAAKASDGH